MRFERSVVLHPIGQTTSNQRDVFARFEVEWLDGAGVPGRGQKDQEQKEVEVGRSHGRREGGEDYWFRNGCKSR